MLKLININLYPRTNATMLGHTKYRQQRQQAIYQGAGRRRHTAGAVGCCSVQVCWVLWTYIGVHCSACCLFTYLICNPILSLQTSSCLKRFPGRSPIKYGSCRRHQSYANFSCFTCSDGHRNSISLSSRSLSPVRSLSLMCSLHVPLNFVCVLDNGIIQRSSK